MVIRALPVGGGILAIAPLAGAGGDYRGDLEHLVHWAPAMVVSVVTDAELVAVGAAGLGAAIQDRGTRWVHLPLPAGAAPDVIFAAGWTRAAPAARRALEGGGRVMVHGNDGIARAGMVALRLMIECGEAGDEAETRLAAALGGPIGTPAQRHWALSARRGPVPFVRGKRPAG